MDRVTEAMNLMQAGAKFHQGDFNLFTWHSPSGYFVKIQYIVKNLSDC